MSQVVKATSVKVLVAALIAAVACVFSFAAADNVNAASKPKITVAGTHYILLGTTGKLGAKTVKGAKLTYASSNKSVVSVSSKGTIQGKKIGSAKITITAKKGSQKNTKKVTVYVKKGGKLKITSSEGTPLSDGIVFLIYNSKGTKVSSVSGESKDPLVPGTYTVKEKTKYTTLTSKKVKVTDGKTTTLKVTPTQAKITVSADNAVKGWRSLIGKKIVVWSDALGHKEVASAVIGSEGTAEFVLPAGVYYFGEVLNEDLPEDEFFKTSILELSKSVDYKKVDYASGGKIPIVATSVVGEKTLPITAIKGKVGFRYQGDGSESVILTDEDGDQITVSAIGEDHKQYENIRAQIYNNGTWHAMRPEAVYYAGDVPAGVYTLQIGDITKQITVKSSLMTAMDLVQE